MTKGYQYVHLACAWRTAPNVAPGSCCRRLLMLPIPLSTYADVSLYADGCFTMHCRPQPSSRYLNIDDCWAKSRSSNGTIVPDPVKFPDGMRAVSNKLHAMGLKFGETPRIPHIAIHELNFTVSVLALLKDRTRTGTGQPNALASSRAPGAVMAGADAEAPVWLMLMRTLYIDDGIHAQGSTPTGARLLAAGGAWRSAPTE